MNHYNEPRGSLWAAAAFHHAMNALNSGVEFIQDQFREIAGPDDCRTPEELRQYAYGIQHRSPSLAKELIEAANRADDIEHK